MSTTQTTPAEVEIRTSKTVFDLDSKSDVTVVKVSKVPEIANMQDFVSRLGNDAEKILTIVRAGYADFAAKQLESDASVAWQTEEEDENGTTVLAPFTGTLLSEDASKSFATNVLNMAKLLFGYPKSKLPAGATAAEKATNKTVKQAAKEKAQSMLLDNPAVIEALKAQ